MELDVYQLFILFADFCEAGQLGDHTVGLLQLRTQLADLLLVGLDDLMEIVELCLSC